MSMANWHPDPTGRFAQRYYDGQRWTAHVAGRDGSQSEDPAPVDPALPAPGSPQAAAAPPVAATGTPAAATAPPVAAASPTGTSVVGPGLLVAGLGALLTILAMFALDWLSEAPAAYDRADLSELVDAFSGADAFNVVTEIFFSFGWIVALVAAIAAVAVPFARALKVPVAVVCLLGAGWALFALIDIVEEMSILDVGAYLAVAGPVVAAVGALMVRPVRP